jgi:hypothetical protein
MLHRFVRAGLLVLSAAVLAVSGCGTGGVGRTASGTTAHRRIDATGVTRLDVAYGFDVRVHLGQPEAVTVTYDDNLADRWPPPGPAAAAAAGLGADGREGPVAVLAGL